MPQDQLSIKVTVDAATVPSALGSVASSVESAASRMAASLKASGLAGAELSSAMKNLGFTAAETATALGVTSTQLKEVEPAADRAAAGVNNARSAFMGLNSELGLHGNRALGAFISQSETLGPALSTAFTGIAILGFIQLAVTAGEKLASIISDTFIFTDAEKRLANQLVKDNVEIQKAYDQHLKTLKEIALIGLDRVAADAKKAQWAKEDGTTAKSRLSTAEADLKVETEKLNKLQAQAATVEQMRKPVAAKGLAGSGSTVAEGSIAVQVKEQQQAVDALIERVSMLQVAARDAGDEVAKTSKTLADTEAKEAIKAAEKAAKEREKIEKEAIKEHLAEYSAAMAEEGKILMEHYKETGKELKENLEFNKEADKEVAESAKELAALKLKLLREVTAENNKEVHAQLQLDKDLERSFEQRINRASAEMASFTHSLLTGNQTIGRSFEQLGANMMLTIIDALEKILVKQMAVWATTNVLEKSSMLTSVTNFITGTSAKKAAEAAANTSSVVGSAGVAGAGAFASVMTALPFPVNVATAPGVMAGAIATTLSNMALASMAGGMETVPHDMLAMIHKDESVIPASYAKGLREMANGGGGASEIHVHYAPKVNAIDQRGVQDFFSQNERELVKTIQRAVRKSNS